MKRIRLACLAAPICMACAGPALQQPGAQAAAADLRPSDADSYLRFLLADDILASGEFRSAQYALGLDRTCELTRPAYQTAFEQLRPGWHRLYAGMVDPARAPGPLEAGREVTLEQRQLLLAMGLAGLDMISERSAAVKDMLMEEALKIDNDAIDYDARGRELTEARSANRDGCALIEAGAR